MSIQLHWQYLVTIIVTIVQVILIQFPLNFCLFSLQFSFSFFVLFPSFSFFPPPFKYGSYILCSQGIIFNNSVSLLRCTIHNLKKQINKKVKAKSTHTGGKWPKLLTWRATPINNRNWANLSFYYKFSSKWNFKCNKYKFNVKSY